MRKDTGNSKTSVSEKKSRDKNLSNTSTKYYWKLELIMATGSQKVIYAALAGNALISITKFIAAFITGSSAMMSEGIHSLIDTANQILLLYGLKQAAKPADENFPFEHDKEIYF